MKITAALIAFAAVTAMAAPPVVRDMLPRGAQRGRTVTLTLRGSDLVAGSRLVTTLPASVSRLTPSQEEGERPGGEIPFLIQLRPDAPIGLYPVRVVSDDGISNVMLFSVGEFPEVEENEAANPKQFNNTAEKAESIATPVVVNGTLQPADEDYYVFTAKAGQTLVFEVEARRAGSAVDPAIELYDATGRLIAKNDDADGISPDARLEATLAQAGRYRVRVRDSRYSEQAQNFYRLKIGGYAWADAMFPLGWRRGEPVDVELSGGNLPAPVKVKPRADLQGALAPVNLAGSAALPMWFQLSDQPETIEAAGPGPHPLAERTIVNGRIQKPGEIDRYRIPVRPGEDWTFEIQAASTRASRLDPLLTLYDSKGKKLASRDDIAGADAALPFTVPAGVSELTLAVEDLLGRGGTAFAYRLEARREQADFLVDLATPFVNVPAGGTVQVVAVVQRRGYDGPIKLSIPDLPPGFRVAGGNVPSEAAAQNFNNDNAGYRTARGVLTLTADENVGRELREITVVGEAETSKGRLTRVARGPGLVTAVRGVRQQGFTAPWLGMKLTLAVSRPLPITLATTAPFVRISQGFEYTLDYRLRRRSGAPTPGRVNDQQVGAVGNIRVNRGSAQRTADGGSVVVATNFATPVTSFDMLFETQADIDGRSVTITSPAVNFEVVQGYTVDLASDQVRVGTGGKAEIRGEVFREPTFEGGLVRIEAQDLPDGVRCAAAEVAAGRTSFTLDCEASATAAPGAWPIRITSSAPDVGRRAKEEYKIPDVAARLTIEPARQASR